MFLLLCIFCLLLSCIYGHLLSVAKFLCVLVDKMLTIFVINDGSCLTAGRRFFEELDRDGDGLVTLEDLEVAMTKRKLPRRYARDFLRHTRSHIFSKSIGWK